MLVHEIIVEAPNKLRRGILKSLAAVGAGASVPFIGKYIPRHRPEDLVPAQTDSGMVKTPPTTPDEKFVKPPPQEIPPAAALKEPSTSPKNIRPNLRPAEIAVLLRRTAERNGIRGIELAALMAQCDVESDGFRALETYLSPDDLKKFDYLKKVGNREAADGYNYRARGLIHLFGRENYDRIGKRLNIDLIQDPDLASDPELAAMIAVEFWLMRVRPYIQRKANNDFANVAAVTYPINHRLEHLDRRRTAFKRWRNLIVPSTT